VQWASDTSDNWALDLSGSGAWALDSSSGKLDLRTAIEHFLTAKAAEGASPKTIDWYRMELGRAGRDLGADRVLDSLTSNELRAWLLALRETLSPISVAGYVRGVKAFGNWCAAEQLAEARALRTLRRPRVPHKLIEPLDDAAVRRMVDVASIRDRAIVLLMLDTGLRLSEVAGLRRCDLRPDGTVKVMGKGARERIVPVGSVARQALIRCLRQAQIADAETVIFRARGGGRLSPRGIQQVFNRMKRRAGIPGRCSPHQLRHAFARAYLVNGGDAFSLQRILGHGTLDMVKRYVALADTDVLSQHRIASPADRLLAPSRR
jgi:site-specific recombinase XerD